MQIAVLGYRRHMREDVEKSIRSCLAPGCEAEIRQYGLDEPIYNAAPPDTVAAFVIVDSATALHALRTVANWGENLPVVIVSNNPQFALEGIRIQVRHYLLFPLVEQDMREALPRVGLDVKSLEVKPLGKNTYF